MSHSHKVDKLNDRNYRDWAMMMRILLDEEGVWDVVSGTAADKLAETMLALKQEPVPEGTKPISADDQQKMKKALRIIVFAIDSSQTGYIKKEDNAYQVWKTFREVREGTSKAQLFRLLKTAVSVSNMKNKSVDHKAQLLQETNQDIRNMMPAAEYSNEALAQFLLESMSAEYSTIVDILLNKDCTWEEIVSSLRGKEMALADPAKLETNKTDTALAAFQSRKRGERNERTCDHCGKPGHLWRSCWDFQSTPEWKTALEKDPTLAKFEKTDKKGKETSTQSSGYPGKGTAANPKKESTANLALMAREEFGDPDVWYRQLRSTYNSNYCHLLGYARPHARVPQWQAAVEGHGSYVSDGCVPTSLLSCPRPQSNMNAADLPDTDN